jgi:NADH-quinone oxidoreductase subunit A
MTLAVYCLLFMIVGVGFIFVHLVAGKLIRPNKPGAEKGTIYECGEPTIGSAWIQFDLRFYVVALLFVVFDVEVAFFFPWAEVFGKTSEIASLAAPTDEAGYKDYCAKVLTLTPGVVQNDTLRDMYLRAAAMQPGDFDKLKKEGVLARIDQSVKANQEDAWWFTLFAFLEILVFFGVLLVGFAYLWKRGDLAWVRSVAAERPPPEPAAAPEPARELAVTSGS